MPARLPPGAFLGDIARTLDVADLMLRETRHAGGQVIPKHVHESAHFCLGIAGACVERIGYRDIECVPGTLEYHPAGTCHASRWYATGGRCFTLTLGESWISRLALDDPTLRPLEGVITGPARGLMVQLHQALTQDGFSPADVGVEPQRPGLPRETDPMALVVEGLTLALIGEARRDREPRVPGRPPAWLRRAEEFLRDQACTTVSATAAAEAAGVHPALLSRWFRRVHGVTVGEFVRRLRIGHACRLLATTNRNLSDVAQACGFADHAHFTRTFCKLVGMPPSLYRATVRE